MVPTSSLKRIYRFPSGKSAWATRAVSSGIGGIAWGCNDIGLLLLVGSLVIFSLSPILPSSFFYLSFLSPTGSIFAATCSRAQRWQVVGARFIAPTGCGGRHIWARADVCPSP